MAYEFKGPTIITKNLGGSKDYFFIVRYNNGKTEYLSIGMNRQPKWVTNFNFASTYSDADSAQAAYDLLMKNYKENVDESSFDGNRFEKNIPYCMRYKEYSFVNGYLYWITQEPFTAPDVMHFIDALEDTYVKKVFIVPRDYSSYNLFKDAEAEVGVTIDLTNVRNSTIWGKQLPYKESIDIDNFIEIQEECQIPGTDFILEKGDKIFYKESKSVSELNNIANGLRNHFKKNKDYYDVYVDPRSDAVCVDITWGDWKHDHLYVDSQVAQYFDSVGISYMSDEKVTDEDGSDTYSATHVYHIF